jgi:hypothetical protein
MLGVAREVLLPPAEAAEILTIWVELVVTEARVGAPEKRAR